MAQNEFFLMMYDQAHPVSALAAHIAAGLFLMWVISLLWEGILFKRVTHDPVIGKLSSAVASWVSLFAARTTTGYAVPGIFRDFDLIALALLSGLAAWSGMRMRAQLRLEDEQV